jgi:hypothetical protein
MRNEMIYITKADRYIVKEQSVVIVNDNYIVVTDDHIPTHVYLFLTFDRGLESNKKGKWSDNKTTTGNICMASYSLTKTSKQLVITINPLYKEISASVKMPMSKVRELNPHIKLFNQRLSLLSCNS